ncbi:hypothetical protein J1N35_007638, partial [Gossypium stocksii]
LCLDPTISTNYSFALPRANSWAMLQITEDINVLTRQFDEGVFPYARLSSAPQIPISNASESLYTLPVIVMPHLDTPSPSLRNKTTGSTLSPLVVVHTKSSQPPASINSNYFGNNAQSPNPSIPDT